MFCGHTLLQLLDQDHQPIFPKLLGFLEGYSYNSSELHAAHISNLLHNMNPD